MFSLPPDVIAEAWRLQREGIDAVNRGRPSVGATILRKGLALARWRADSPYCGNRPAQRVLARLLISLSYAEAELGRPRYGLDLLDVAVNFAAADQTGYLMVQRGGVLWKAGESVSALESLAKSEQSLCRIGALSALAQMLLNKSIINTELGRYSEAREDLRRCVEIADAESLSMLSVKALHSRGIIEHGVGDIPAALQMFDQAKQRYESEAPDMIPLLEISTAAALREVGLRHEAAVRLDKAIHTLSAQGRSRELLNSEVHRARIALELGEYEKAENFASRAHGRAMRQESKALADWAERVLREAQFHRGTIDSNFPHESFSLAARQRLLCQTDIAELAELLAARAAIKNDDLGFAKAVLQRRARSTGAQVLVAKITRQLGRAEMEIAATNPSGALSRLRYGLNELHSYRESFGSLELQAGVSAVGRELVAKGLGVALGSGRATTVFAWSERSRAQAYRLPSVHPPEDPETADLLARIRTLHGVIQEAEREGRSSRDTTAELRQREEQLRQRSWQLAGPGDSIPELRPKQIREELAGAGHRLVSFLRHDGQLHALTVTAQNVKHHPLGPARPIEELARRLAADLEALTGRRLPERMATAVRASVRHQLDQLSDALFGAFESRLGDSDLLVVPTGALTSLPWNLLPPFVGRPVTVAPSAAVWWDARRRNATGSAVPLLASGPELRNAETELDTLAESYPAALVLRGDKSSPDAILSALDGAPIAHLAAHGRHEPDNVLFSRMEFAGGPLMAYDIARLATPPAHVTLSACDVGQSTVAIGDETLGFTAALLYAGTRTVVSSVAKVEHEAAADVMTAYHRGLVDGHNPARALADAATLHPLSPFVCYGAG